jgi:hypothetical protein
MFVSIDIGANRAPRTNFGLSFARFPTKFLAVLRPRDQFYLALGKTKNAFARNSSKPLCPLAMRRKIATLPKN